MSSIYYTVFQNKNVFIPLRYLYPECSVFISEHDEVNQLQCLETSCPVDQGCMYVLAKRLSLLFEHLEDAQLVIAYYKLRSGRIRAGVFRREMEEPRVITCNPSALTKFQREGNSFEWQPGSDFFEKKAELLIPQENLIR